MPRVLPQLIQGRIEEIERLLRRDIDQARTALRRFLGYVVLRPTPAGLVAELRGSIQGLLNLDEQALNVVNCGSGGRICTRFGASASRSRQVDLYTG